MLSFWTSCSISSCCFIFFHPTPDLSCCTSFSCFSLFVPLVVLPVLTAAMCFLLYLDAQTVIAFLKTYGLEDDFKVSLLAIVYTPHPKLSVAVWLQVLSYLFPVWYHCLFYSLTLNLITPLWLDIPMNMMLSWLPSKFHHFDTNRGISKCTRTSDFVACQQWFLHSKFNGSAYYSCFFFFFCLLSTSKHFKGLRINMNHNNYY